MCPGSLSLTLLNASLAAVLLLMYSVSQNHIFIIYTLHDRIFYDFPAKTRVYTMYVWFWPTLLFSHYLLL